MEPDAPVRATDAAVAARASTIVHAGPTNAGVASAPAPVAHVASAPSGWRLGFGAEPVDDGVAFRVWAPIRRTVDVVLERDGRVVPLAPAADGFFAATVEGVVPGDRYRYRLDGGDAYPDPASRFQPEGPHGPSQVVDPRTYRWHDAAWPGVALRGGQVIYELHVGTCTRDGTLDAAASYLPALRDLGVTLVELMPVAETTGRWNWGYDGVDLYAPSHRYGDPDALRRFVDAAHGLGLGVLLDVVYNHLGPDGNYLTMFSDRWFTTRYPNEWGEPLDFDGPGSGPVRDFFVQNACYWIAEFHVDGLRLDATQSIHDASPRHVLAELSVRARAAAGRRGIVLVAENEPQEARCLRPVEAGGFGLDALWNDDFHHSARLAVGAARREAYFVDYRGCAREMLACVLRGFLYQGQLYRWQGKRRGTPAADLPPRAFVLYTQNHDQVANGLRGERLHELTQPGLLRAVTALQLLAPGTPMLFMGQDWAASQPFTFFADHGDGELRRAVTAGRRRFLAQFPSFATPEAQAQIPDPCDAATFRACTLDPGERTQEPHASTWRLHADLLHLRRGDPVLRDPERDVVDGAVLAECALLVRWRDVTHGDRLLLVNLGVDVDDGPVPEPLRAPPPGATWRLLWGSEEPRYGGHGIAPPQPDTSARIPATSAWLFAASDDA